ncbi:MAG: hypothetical protein IJ532_05235 [Alphaproteobacteria bacterium]|nr:hypothetical protein [Alphaproteobacteria bacterium]
MDNEELENLEIKKNEDLNEEAEYAGNKQDLERMLLEAQRYLNIFHQIHIFSSKKKAEFEQSLIDMPERIRAVLLNLPGGRVLNEYIEDCEIKRGLREARTEFADNDTFVKSEREIQQQSAIANKEFTQSLKEVMENYNTNLLQLSEKIMQNSKRLNDDERNSSNQTKALIDALRENNKHQVEMLKTLGTTLSQAILNAKKEEKQNNGVINKKEETAIKVSGVAPKENLSFAVKEEIKKNESISAPKGSNINDIPVLHKFDTPAPAVKNNIKDDSGTEDIRQALSKNQEINKPVNKSPEVSDIDIASLLGGDLEQNEKEQKSATQQKPPVALDSATLLKEAQNNSKETLKDKPQTFGNAMQKIKNAITETASISLDKIKEAPISLGDIKDDLTDSFSKAFSSKKEEPIKPAAEEEWEYVDENGNPINPEEWGYVDENGNPVNPEEWEYVDENGNPINPEEWEYVDENGNPIAK